MAQLRQDHQQFVERNTEVIVVGPEGASAFRRYWAENELPFTGLPDPSHSVLKKFGQEVSLFKLGRMPAQVIVDRQGIVRFAHYGHVMMDIPENQELLGLIDEINQQPDPSVSESQSQAA
jgi:peroxiredoxin Q/BCP